MPTIERCLISVDTALALRKLIDSTGLEVPNGNLGFMCPECKRSVKPHEGDSAHFEHLRRNSNCSLSHPSPKAGK
jgi:hypothetical protein